MITRKSIRSEDVFGEFPPLSRHNRHQNATLILGRGGVRFGDYWKLGLPLDILVVAISIPILLIVWPL